MKKTAIILSLFLFHFSCSNNDENEGYSPVAVDIEIPTIFSNNIIPPIIPTDNPQTVEGITLGKKLFFDPILSGDQSIACATCHSPTNAFTDNTATSIGVDGINGNRNACLLYTSPSPRD